MEVCAIETYREGRKSPTMYSFSQRKEDGSFQPSQEYPDLEELAGVLTLSEGGNEIRNYQTPRIILQRNGVRVERGLDIKELGKLASSLSKEKCFSL